MVLQSITPGTARLVHRPFTVVMLRVTYQLVRYDRSLHPDKYQGHVPTRLIELADELRGQFPELWPWLHYYARNMAHGYTMSYLRDTPTEYQMRSVAKLKPRSSGRKR